VNITFYDTVEEMLDDLSKAMQEADKRVKPWQAQIKKGDYFRQETEYGFDIHGQVLHGYREKRLRNYRFCYCFSPACPEGERGECIPVSLLRL